MTSDQAMKYIGLPYGENAEGPDRYNCWGLLRHVQRVYFHRELPAINIGDMQSVRNTHAEASHNGIYWPIDKPEHGDAVLLRGGNDPHVGIWLEFDGGGVLHSMSGKGVIYTPNSMLRCLGFSRSKYYRIRDASPLHSLQGSVQAFAES